MWACTQRSLYALNNLQTFNAAIARVFVSCLCEDGDLLSQWNLYGQDGYAIGVRSDAIQRASFHDFTVPTDIGYYFVNGPYVELHKIKYVDEVDTTVIDRGVIDRIVPPDTAMGQTPRVQEAEWRSFYELASIKHKAFRQEQEWRLIYVARADKVSKMDGEIRSDQPVVPPVLFRSSQTTIVPYIELEIDRQQAVAEIVVGPSPNQALRVEAVKRLLHQSGLSDVLVTPSDTAFRG